MTKEDMLTVVNSDMATLEIVGLLISFLEAKGVMDRAEFIAFSRSITEDWKRQGQSEGLATALQLQIDGLDLAHEYPKPN